MKPVLTKNELTKEQWSLVENTKEAIRDLKMGEKIIVDGRTWERLSPLKWSYDKPLGQDELREIAN